MQPEVPSELKQKMWSSAWIASSLLPLVILAIAFTSDWSDCGPGCAGGVIPSFIALGIAYLFFVALCPLLAIELWRRQRLSAFLFIGFGLFIVLVVPVIPLCVLGSGELLITEGAIFWFSILGGFSLSILGAWWLITFGLHNNALNTDAPKDGAPVS